MAAHAAVPAAVGPHEVRTGAAGPLLAQVEPQQQR